MNETNYSHTTFAISRARVGLAICAMLAGCGSATEAGDDGEATESSADSGVAADDDAGASGDGGASGDAGTGELPPEMAVCGDGFVQGAEECDDGINDGSYGGCNADCTAAAYCGDGTLNGADEVCDDGDVDSSDGCLANCSIPASCEDIKDFEPDADDGNYVIDPDGPLGEEPDLVYCDMTTLAVEWSEPTQIPGNFGNHTGGAGVAIGEVGAGAGPDMVVFHIEDEVTPTRGYYRIAWNLDDKGDPTLGWTEPRQIPALAGTSEAEGGDITLADVDGNGALDLVVLHVDDPWGPNQAYYRVGFDLDQDGNVAGGWTEPFPVGGELANGTDGGGVAVADLNGNDALELIVFHLEDPNGGNDGRLQIGWDLDLDGEVAIWGPSTALPGWFGSSNEGAGLEIIDATNGPALVVFHIDDPAGENQGYFRVGRQLDAAGWVAGGWSEPTSVPGWWGNASRYGGVAAWDLGNDGHLDMLYLHVDRQNGPNVGHYRWGYGG